MTAVSTFLYQASSEPKTAPIKVLIVDDQETFSDAVALMLRMQQGIDVVGSAESIEGAVAAVRAHEPDVVLMDFRLPDGDGAVGCRSIKEAFPRAQVVVLTGFSDSEVLIECIQAGCAGFVTKQGSIEEVVSAIKAAAAGEALITPRMLVHLISRARRDLQPVTSQLTRRQIQILQLMAQGLSSDAIAKKLGISPNTVRNHTNALMSRMKAHSKLSAVMMAMREGLIHDWESEES